MFNKTFKDKQSACPGNIAVPAQMIANPTAAKSPRELESSSDPGLLELNDKDTKPPIPFAMTMEKTLGNTTEKKTYCRVHVRPDASLINSLELGVETTNDNYAKKIAEVLGTIREDDELQGPSNNTHSNYYNRLVGCSSGPPRNNQKSNVAVPPPGAHGRDQGTTLPGNNDSNSDVTSNIQGAYETVPPMETRARDPDGAQAVIVLDASVQDMSDIPEAFLVENANVVTEKNSRPKASVVRATEDEASACCGL
jgi:hypothetical protein